VLQKQTAAKLMYIGFVEQELQFFTEEQAQETIRRFNEKLNKTRDFKKCCVTVGKE
jgi:stress response protein YsnF